MLVFFFLYYFCKVVNKNINVIIGLGFSLFFIKIFLVLLFRKFKRFCCGGGVIVYILFLCVYNIFIFLK